MSNLLFQGLPPPDPRFSFPGAAAPGPPLFFPRGCRPWNPASTPEVVAPNTFLLQIQQLKQHQLGPYADPARSDADPG